MLNDDASLIIKSSAPWPDAPGASDPCRSPSTGAKHYDRLRPWTTYTGRYRWPRSSCSEADEHEPVRQSTTARGPGHSSGSPVARARTSARRPPPGTRRQLLTRGDSGGTRSTSQARRRGAGRAIGGINDLVVTHKEVCMRTAPIRQAFTRWIKGYMQTALVHTRHPVADLFRDLGAIDALGFLLLIGGPPLTFLAAPILWRERSVVGFGSIVSSVSWSRSHRAQSSSPVDGWVGIGSSPFLVIGTGGPVVTVLWEKTVERFVCAQCASSARGPGRPRQGGPFGMTRRRSRGGLTPVRHPR